MLLKKQKQTKQTNKQKQKTKSTQTDKLCLSKGWLLDAILNISLDIFAYQSKSRDFMTYGFLFLLFSS